jgi:two-component system response regulator HydG
MDVSPPFFDAEQLLDTMAEGVVAIDRSGRIRAWNQAIADLTGYAANEALGQSVSWLRAPDCINAEKLEGLLNNEAAPSCITGCECRLRDRSGTSIPVTVNARVLRDKAGKTIGALQTITDLRPIQALQAQVNNLRLTHSPRDSFEGLVGRSHAMQEVFRMLELAAASDATVLLRGESGTGKELAAAALHQRSARADQPFVRVNCGALNDALLESELFGHVRGAFTGAVQDRIGRFETAEGGTLFLDEIGDISTNMQVKLLRILQEAEYERVGESQTRKSNVRIVAATNRDLEQAITKGTFREDLYYRLRVIPITLPSLRDRPEDLAPLVDHFVAHFARRTGKAIHSLHSGAMQAIQDYTWPGNIRELENTIEYAFVVCQDAAIGIQHLPRELTTSPTSVFLQPPPSTPARRPRHPLSAATRKTLRDPEKLRDLLATHNWNKADVARTLKCSHTAVWKWMRQHGIPLQRD